MNGIGNTRSRFGGPHDSSNALWMRRVSLILCRCHGGISPPAGTKRKAGIMEVEVLTVPQVAERLQLSRRTVWHLIGRGELATVRIGRLRRVLPSDLSEYLDRCRVKNGGPAASGPERTDRPCPKRL